MEFYEYNGKVTLNSIRRPYHQNPRFYLYKLIKNISLPYKQDHLLKPLLML